MPPRFVEFNGEEAKRVYGETSLSHREDARIVNIKQPIGVVGAITPWNFPAAMITRKCAPAIAAGCTVVVQAGRRDAADGAGAGRARRARRHARRACSTSSPARPSEIGEELTANPTVRCIAFTGSTEVGKLLMRQAAATVKKVALELGGNAPFIVFDDADLDAAVEGAIFSKFRNIGQTCVCANRILVQDTIYDAFAEKLASAVTKLKVGRGTEVGVVQGPLINMAAVEKVEQHIADAVANGAEVVVGGHRHKLGGTFFEPTVLEGVTTAHADQPRGDLRSGRAPLSLQGRGRGDRARQRHRVRACRLFLRARPRPRLARRRGARIRHGRHQHRARSRPSSRRSAASRNPGIGREGSHYGIEEFVEIKYMLMGGLDG